LASAVAAEDAVGAGTMGPHFSRFRRADHVVVMSVRGMPTLWRAQAVRSGALEIGARFPAHERGVSCPFVGHEDDANAVPMPPVGECAACALGHTWPSLGINRAERPMASSVAAFREDLLRILPHPLHDFADDPKSRRQSDESGAFMRSMAQKRSIAVGGFCERKADLREISARRVSTD